MSDKSFNFFCGRCVRAVCDDCKNVGMEALELSALRAHALFEAESENKRLRQELELATKRAAEWERLMKLGQHPLMVAWMDNNDLSKIVQQTEAAAQPGYKPHGPRNRY